MIDCVIASIFVIVLVGAVVIIVAAAVKEMRE